MRRSDADPYWALGQGFGPVRSRCIDRPLPWEDGTFSFLGPQRPPLGALFEELLRLPPAVPVPVPTEAVSQESRQGQGCQAVPVPLASASPGALSREDALLRRQALSKWVNLLRIAPQLFDPVTVEQLPAQGETAVMNHLDLLFCKKSSNTLLLRCQPLTRFVLWAQRSFPDEVISEALIFAHCKVLITKGAAASSLDILVSSFNFLHGTLGLGVPLKSLISQRVQGLAHQHLRTKRPTLQAEALTVAQVLFLEFVAAETSDPYEKLVAATLCFMLYARARRSDLERATDILFDIAEDGVSGFVECTVRNPKQVKAASRRNMMLPLVAPYHGIGEQPWGRQLRQAREAMCLSNSGSLAMPLLPALNTSGKLLPSHVSSRDLGRWLRAFLSRQPGCDPAAVTSKKSHSLKATPLSWAAKAHLDQNTQDLLGYHTSRVNLSTLSYSRDALAGPLRQLDGLLQAVRQKSFLPDSTRSGRWAVAPQPTLTLPATASSSSTVATAEAPAVAACAVETSSSSGSDTAESSSEDGDEQRVLGAPHFLEAVLSLGRFAVARNKRSNLHHVLNQESVRLLCGRPYNNSFECLDSIDADTSTFCKTCQQCSLQCT